MCGITGWASTIPERMQGAAPILAGMRDKLRHRGPDDHGSYFELEEAVPERGGVALGFRRLSIVDLDGGHQPMANEDGQVWVVFNGEIYNHLDLRQELTRLGHTFATSCDTEVLVHGWEAWGEALLPRLNGMFDLAIWDGGRRELFLARDRFGKKPLFYASLDGDRTLVFGTELSAVLAHPQVPADIDPEGLQSLLLFDYVTSPCSMIRGVRTLEPGTWLRWTPDGQGGARVRSGAWYVPSPPDPQLGRLNESQAVAELDRRLQRAVERRLMADVPLGIFLSGGIDSSLVAYYAARLRPPATLDTFAIGFEDASFDESAHARSVARHLGTRHHERILGPAACVELAPQLTARLDQPLADGSILPTSFLCAFARESVTVALGGDGGDEWFLGYPTFYAHGVARMLDRAGLGRLQPLLQRAAARLPVAHGNLSLDFQIKRFVAGLGYDGGMRHIAWIGGLEPRQHHRVLRPEVLAALGDRLEQRVEAVWRSWRAVGRDDADGLAALYARFYLGDGVLQKVDRASMLHSLEVRAPLLDPEVVELARALPTSFKLRGRTTKAILRRLAHDKLPHAIVRRPKKGFGVPLAQWLRGPLRAWMTDLLAPARLADSPWLDPVGVQRLVDEHLGGRADHRKVLWALLCFCSWHERLRADSASLGRDGLR